MLARTPLKRFGEPGEIGRVAVFLASDEAPFINASCITIELRQYNAIKTNTIQECLRCSDRILSDHCIYDKQNLIWIDCIPNI